MNENLSEIEFFLKLNNRHSNNLPAEFQSITLQRDCGDRSIGSRMMLLLADKLIHTGISIKKSVLLKSVHYYN